MRTIRFIAFFLVVLQCGINNVSAQSKVSKPVLDSVAIEKSDRLLNDESCALSKDGLYVSYGRKKSKGNNGIVIQRIDDSWKMEAGRKNPRVIGFSDDNKHFLYSEKDSLYNVELYSGKSEVLGGIISYKPLEFSVLTRLNYGKWLAIEMHGKKVVLRNFVSGKEFLFYDVTSFDFGKNANSFLVKRKVINSADTTELLQWMDLENEEIKTIWESDKTHPSILSVSRFDNDGKKLIFLVHPVGGAGDIWYYKMGMKRAVLKVDGKGKELSALIIDDNTIQFSETGNFILFKLRKMGTYSNSKATSVDVWGYHSNNYLEIVKELNSGRRISPPNLEFQASLAVESNNQGLNLLRLDRYEEIKIVGDVVIIHKYFNPVLLGVLESDRLKDEYNLVTLIDGKTKHLSTGDLGEFTCSPDMKWVVFFNKGKKNYYSYEMSNGQTRNISGLNRLGSADRNVPFDGGDGIAWSIDNCKWLDNNKILVTDRYDLWKMDPGGQPAVNLTKGYGRKHSMLFRLRDEDLTKNISDTSILILSVLNQNTKYKGVYRFQLNQISVPEQLFLGPNEVQLLCSSEYTSSSKTWLIKKGSPLEYPNYFTSHDLKAFKPLTDVHGAEKEYNWFSKELVKFKQLDGKQTEGVLYKPDDFDGKKKYPVIFYYYDRSSHNFYSYEPPDYCGGNINIPWYVSRGYLVFVPDIHYSKGQPGKSAFNSVLAAANMLSKRPYVDANKMGIQGHSFGGTETNYIISHTNLFAAAFSAAGSSDMVSLYGNPYTPINNFWVEFFQGRMGAPPALAIKDYIDESPVFHVEKITTPILLMYNRNDNTTPFSQGRELFVGLWRMNKMVWLLQYDDGNHVVTGRDQIDLTIRGQQFFDHYLKDAPVPMWMSQGVPGYLKQIESGLEIDPDGICGKDCKICMKKRQGSRYIPSLLIK